MRQKAIERSRTSFSFMFAAFWLPILVITIAGFQVVAYCRNHSSEIPLDATLQADLPKLERTSEYVSSKKCVACHPGEHASWHASFHRTMTQVALPETVAGAFDGTTISVNGLDYRVFKKGDEFWAEMPDPDIMMYTVQGGRQIDAMNFIDKAGRQVNLKQIPRVERRVIMSTGSHHYQTYWVSGHESFGRLLQTLPMIYLIKDQRWIPREAAFMHPPEPTHILTQWNHHCIKCHSTGGNPAVDVNDPKGKFNTEVGELGISCEACHGPAEEHVKINQNILKRYQFQMGIEEDHSIINPANLDHKKSSQICGQCHGVFRPRNEFGLKYATEGLLYRPGDDLDKFRHYMRHPMASGEKDSRQFELNRKFFEERWWPDGSVLAGGREYTAMIESGCYQRGKMSCLSCHSMHDSDPVDQLSEKMETSHACTQCHTEKRFNEDVQSHTHHASDSTGSNCLNCHMPHTAYALLGAIRSHQITSPNATKSLLHNTPNACNLCHLDRTLSWTVDHLHEWYGFEKDVVSDEQQQISAGLLWLLKGDAAQRVITAWHFGWQPAKEISGSDWMAPFLAELLNDPYGVVRYVAFDALKTQTDFNKMDFDFLDSRDSRTKVIHQVIEKWQNLKHPSHRESEQLLIKQDGSLNRELIQKLLREQDQRPVTIKE